MEKQKLEMIPESEGVIARYYIETDGDLNSVAEHMAWEETIGGQMDFEQMSPLLKACTGRVYKVEEIESGKGFVEILLPIINMDYKTAPFAHIWMFMAGGPVFELTSYKKIRLIDFFVPDVIMKEFPGPLMGINNFRNKLGLDSNDVLLGAIVKPCCGMTEAEVADYIFDVASAGVHLIKDDEKMNNVSYCQLGKRVKLVQEKLEIVKKETGIKPLYVSNITTRPDRILDNARAAIDNGAEGLMLNMFAAGFDSISILRDADDINLPIYIHSGTRSALNRVEGQGIDLNVIAKFARYLGGDFFRTGVSGGYCVGTQEQFSMANKSLQEPIKDMNDTIPALSGGLRAGFLPENIKNNGLDVVYMAGSSFAGHPMGFKAGVDSFKQAADAYRLGVQVEEYAKTHEELEIALNIWGFPKK